MNRIYLETPDGYQLYTISMDRPRQVTIPAFLIKTIDGTDQSPLKTYDLCSFTKHPNGDVDLYYREKP